MIREWGKCAVAVRNDCSVAAVGGGGNKLAAGLKGKITAGDGCLNYSGDVYFKGAADRRFCAQPQLHFPWFAVDGLAFSRKEAGMKGGRKSKAAFEGDSSFTSFLFVCQTWSINCISGPPPLFLFFVCFCFCFFVFCLASYDGEWRMNFSGISVMGFLCVCMYVCV